MPTKTPKPLRVAVGYTGQSFTDEQIAELANLRGLDPPAIASRLNKVSVAVSRLNRVADWYGENDYVTKQTLSTRAQQCAALKKTAGYYYKALSNESSYDPATRRWLLDETLGEDARAMEAERAIVEQYHQRHVLGTKRAKPPRRGRPSKRRNQAFEEELRKKLIDNYNLWPAPAAGTPREENLRRDDWISVATRMLAEIVKKSP